jgi:prepilin-type N-terminal cleavage/methylation domain-containing protein
MDRSQSGFSLVETLVALAILTTCLLLGMALLLQHPWVVRRVDAERQAYRALESTLESVRAGVIPLESVTLDGFVTAAGRPAPKDLKLAMTVELEDLPGLYRVILVARYSVGRQKLEKRVETMIWRLPEPSP